MGNDCLWLIKKYLLRPILFSSNTEVGFFATHGQCTHSSNLVSKSPNNREHLASHAATATIWITHRDWFVWHILVAATHNPIELLWKPGRSTAQPVWLHCPTCTQSLSILTAAT